MTSHQKKNCEVRSSEERLVDRQEVFSKNLRFLRAKNKEKQEALAYAVGISQSVISGYEKGVKLLCA